MALLKCMILAQLAVVAFSGPPKKEIKIAISSIETCDQDSKSKIAFKKDALDFDFDLPSGMDDKMKVEYTMESGGEGKWVKRASSSGEACKLVNQFIPGLVKRTAKDFQPALGAKCPWKKGTYKLKDFNTHFRPDDFNMPISPDMYKVSLSVKDKSKTYLCVVLIANVST